jgi:hypothetical protein
MAWQPPEAAAAWQPPEATGWAPPEASTKTISAPPVQRIDPNAAGGFNYGGQGQHQAGGLRLDGFSANDLPDAQSVHEVYADLTRPAVVLPKFTVNPDDSRTAAALKAAANLGISLPEFAESPLGIASIATGTVLPRVVAGAFTADTVKNAGEQATEMGANWDAMTPAQRMEAGVNMGGNVLLAAAMAHGATRGEPTAGAQLADELNRTQPTVPTWAPPEAKIQQATPNAPIAITPDLGAALQSALRGNQGENLLRSKAGELPAAPSAEATPTKNVPPAMAPPAGPAEQSISPATPATAANLVDVPVHQVPADAIATRPDLMQFKRMDDTATGLNEGDKLTGKWDDLKAGNLLLWEPKNPADYGLSGGQKYIVANGHHRFEFGKADEVPAFNAQVVREADGISAEDARRLGAEINIADGKGTIYDQAKFIRNTATTHGADEAVAAARRIGARGRQAADIGLAASDPLWDSFINEQIKPETAHAIVKAAPGDASAQAIGIKYAAQGKPADFIANVMKASQAEAGQRAQSLDLFGNDDSAMQQMEAQAARATELQKDLRQRIQVLQAGKRVEIAKSENIDVKNPQAIPARIQELKAELDRWQNWPMQPDLVAKVKGQVEPAPKVEIAKPKVVEQPGVVETLYHQSPSAVPIESFQPKRAMPEIYYFSTRKDVLSQMIKHGASADVTKPKQLVTAEINYGRVLDLRPDQVADETPVTHWIKVFQKAGVEIPEHLQAAAQKNSMRQVPVWQFINAGYKELRDAMVKAGYDAVKFDEWGGTTTGVFNNRQIKIKRTFVKPDAKSDFSLAKPESVEEQKARLETERQKEELRVQNEKLATEAAKPLVGSVGDIGQGDLLGGGDLFSAGGKQPAEPVANKIAGMGGPVRQRPAKVTVPKEVAATPAPAAHPLRQYFADRLAGLRGIMAPQALGGGAREVANALRHFMGKNALAMARADEALKSFRKEFDKQSKEANYNVIDALERDPSQLPARYQELAQLFRKEFDWRIAEIQKYAPNALQHLIENYFPHIWKDPKRAASTMAQVSSRLFAGRKEFLKQRTIDFFKDGIEAGLEPISDNPVDLLMAKMHSMDKFLLALRAQSEFRASGAMKFKYLFERMPDGWQTMDDPSFIVQKPPVVDIKEAFDSFQRAKMGEILQDLGVSYKRVASLGGTRWAEADMGMKEIRAKIGAHEPTLWHELGHQADWKFPELRDALPVRGNSAVAVQLRKLADLRAEGQEVSDSHKKYLRATEEKMAELFRAYVHAPDLFKETAPDVLRVFEGFLNTQPKLRNNLLELRRGRLAMGDETTQVKLGGMQVLGHWIMPDGPAQVIGNYLSPGLARFSAYNSFRVASNLLNAAQLGMSGFHLGFTSLDAATSRLAVGIEDLAAGNVTRAAKTFASVPVSPVTNILQGRRMMQEALHPGTTTTETAALVKALEQGGGRTGQDRFWQTDFIRRMNKAFHEGTATGYLKGALLAPASAVEAAMKPIMEYVVPRQKLGVFADMARREMERLGPDASVEDTREAMRKAWDSVDNRMGQVVYDNLFYNRAVKDLALVTFRAYGWQLGKYREGFGAITDATKAAGAVVKGQRPELSHRMAYAMALPLMVGTIGGVMTYLMTGQRPQDYKDYFMPRTGETDPRGNPVRLNLPSYMKDVLAYAKHPITSVEHSLNPMFSAISDLLNNKDFYDVRIRNPDDPLWQQGSEVAQFAAKQFIPFTFTGTMKLREDAAPLWKQVFPFFGVTPAPARMTMTPAQELSAEITSASMSGAPRTKEQYDKSKLIKDIVTDFKRGQPDSARAKMAQGFQSHQLNENSVHQIIDRQIYNPLQFQVLHMDVPTAMRVWRVANPEERAKLQPMILQKVWNSKTLAPEQIAATIQEIQRATTTATTGH